MPYEYHYSHKAAPALPFTCAGQNWIPRYYGMNFVMHAKCIWSTVSRNLNSHTCSSSKIEIIPLFNTLLCVWKLCDFAISRLFLWFYYCDRAPNWLACEQQTTSFCNLIFATTSLLPKFAKIKYMQKFVKVVGAPFSSRFHGSWETSPLVIVYISI